MVNKHNLAITLYRFVEMVIILQIRNYSVDMQINRPSSDTFFDTVPFLRKNEGIATVCSFLNV